MRKKEKKEKFRVITIEMGYDKYKGDVYDYYYDIYPSGTIYCGAYGESSELYPTIEDDRKIAQKIVELLERVIKQIKKKYKLN